MNAPTHTHKWMNGLLDEWIIGLMDSTGVDGSVIHLSTNHYDLMALNAENPETFRWFCGQRGLGGRCVIARRMEPFVWS